MDREEFWTTDDDEAVLAEYLAQHSFATSFEGDSFIVHFGDPERLPDPTAEEAECALCDSPVKLVPSVGWRHVLGMRQRRGCTTPFPKAA